MTTALTANESTKSTEPMEQNDEVSTNDFSATKENDTSPTSSSGSKRPLVESSDQNVESEMDQSADVVSGAKKLKLETDSAWKKKENILKTWRGKNCGKNSYCDKVTSFLGKKFVKFTVLHYYVYEQFFGRSKSEKAFSEKT